MERRKRAERESWSQSSSAFDGLARHQMVETESRIECETHRQRFVLIEKPL